MKKKTPADIAKEKRRVKAYVASLAPVQRKHIKALISIIRSASPKVEDGVSWGMPFFRIDGKLFMGCAAFKNHCSIFPVTLNIQKKFARELKSYTGARSMLRLPLDRPVPATLVKRLARARLADVKAGAGMRGPKRKSGR